MQCFHPGFLCKAAGATVVRLVKAAALFFASCWPFVFGLLTCNMLILPESVVTALSGGSSRLQTGDMFLSELFLMTENNGKFFFYAEIGHRVASNIVVLHSWGTSNCRTPLSHIHTHTAHTHTLIHPHTHTPTHPYTHTHSLVTDKIEVWH